MIEQGEGSHPAAEPEPAAGGAPEPAEAVEGDEEGAPQHQDFGKQRRRVLARGLSSVKVAGDAEGAAEERASPPAS